MRFGGCLKKVELCLSTSRETEEVTADVSLSVGGHCTRRETMSSIFMLIAWITLSIRGDEEFRNNFN